MENGAKMERLGKRSLAVAALVGIVVLMLAFSTSAADLPYLDGCWLLSITSETAAGGFTMHGVSLMSQDAFSDTVKGTILSSTPSMPVETPAGTFRSEPIGQGTWKWLGEDEYLANEIHLVKNEKGFPIASLIVRMHIVMTGPDTSEYTIQTYVYDMEGNQLYQFGAASGTGRRLGLEPLE
jgi:hypothetical protein